MSTSSQRRLGRLASHLLACPEASSSSRPSINRNNACGIVAYVSSREEGDAFQVMLDGLRILENRGYDSAGITTVNSNRQLVTSKFASQGTKANGLSRLAEAAALHKGGHSGIAHTRWATHGGRTDENAHPHNDMRNRVSLTHNGVIENAPQLKKKLQQEGVTFRSATDTEVIVQLIGQFLEQGQDVATAVASTQPLLEGTWGLAVIDSQAPDQIIAVSNGSPLLIGLDQGRTFVASEAAAFSNYTKSYISLEEGDIAIVTADGHNLTDKTVESASDIGKIELSPAPYPHWTLKEIDEQSLAISRSLNYGGRILDAHNVVLGGLEQNRENLQQIKHLIISSCGTSLFASMFGAKLMRWLGSFETVQVIDAAELNLACLPHDSSTGGFCAISQSGETKDVCRALELAISNNLTCFSVVNAVRSLIARTTSCGVYLNAGRENGVASTKAFTCQATVLALIAVWFSQIRAPNHSLRKRKELINALHRLPTNFGMTYRSVKEQCVEVAKMIDSSSSLFVLGKGLAEPIAKEGALKIKEISYLHAEGYSGGALKHGPYALIEEGTPIILLLLNDEHEQMMRTAAHEVKTRGALTIVITDLRKEHHETLRAFSDVVLHIPNNGPMSAVLAALPLQLIAYELAVLRGYNPDRPRNLAKAVTVD
eukprot:TRINITY_DN9383_c0_g1_i1.p1 TRINITY_DN9383_c0_g1~~TRINITY_DN9383_c0_g1_i1.p1  ORF type:complete len:656 (+),score=134.63 TRINITY_DN9383_c0_g1_i1:154-2121(+)